MAQEIDDFKKLLNLMASAMPKGATPCAGLSDDQQRALQNFSHYLSKLLETYKNRPTAAKEVTPPWMPPFANHPLFQAPNWHQQAKQQPPHMLKTMEGLYQNSLEMWSQLIEMNLEHYERAQFRPFHLVDHDRCYQIELSLEQPDSVSIRVVGDELRLRQINNTSKEIHQQWAVTVPDEVERDLIQAQRTGNKLIIKLPKSQKIQDTVQDIIVEQEI